VVPLPGVRVALVEEGREMRRRIKLRVTGSRDVLEELSRTRPGATLRETTVELAAREWRRERGVPEAGRKRS